MNTIKASKPPRIPVWMDRPTAYDLDMEMRRYGALSRSETLRRLIGEVRSLREQVVREGRLMPAEVRP